MRRLLISLICMLYTNLLFSQSFNVQCEDTCTHIHGIDLSHYQGEVFWETLGDNKHIAYVYLKATEGGDNIDPTYKKNIDLARKNGLQVGSYHFFRPKTNLSLQLKNFMAQCKPDDQDLIPMIDVETKSGLSTPAFLDSLHKFMLMVEEAYKQKPLLYTFTNFYNKYMQGQFDRYCLMIAQYSDNQPVLNDGRDYFMWQYTAKGRISGINTFVDKSRLMNDHSLREIKYIRNNKRHYSNVTEYAINED